MRNEPKRHGRTWRRFVSTLAGAAASVWLTAAPVFGQQQQGGPKLEASKPAKEWGIAAVLILASLVVAFKNSKRAHVQ